MPKPADRDDLVSRSKRQLIGATSLAGVAATLPAASRTPAAARAPVATSVVRSRYSISAPYTLAAAGVVYHMPLTTVLFEEGSDVALQPGGMVRVMTTGLYRVVLSLDWVAQKGFDIDLRLYSVKRKQAGDPPVASNKDERIASVDMPGSDSPRMGRYQGTWNPGAVPARGTVATEVSVSPAGAVGLGDLAQATFSGASDAAVGTAAADGLLTRARLIDTDRVRVTIRNLQEAGVTLANGDLHVLAQSATLTRGESADAWDVLHTPAVVFNAGEHIYVGVRNKGMDGDYIQDTNATYMQVERLM